MINGFKIETVIYFLIFRRMFKGFKEKMRLNHI